MALFMNGAQGGMITADNRDLDRPEGRRNAATGTTRGRWEECLRIGHLMADEALRLVEDAPEQDGPDALLRLDRRALPGRVGGDVGRRHSARP